MAAVFPFPRVPDGIDYKNVRQYISNGYIGTLNLLAAAQSKKREFIKIGGGRKTRSKTSQDSQPLAGKADIGTSKGVARGARRGRTPQEDATWAPCGGAHAAAPPRPSAGLRRCRVGAGGAAAADEEEEDWAAGDAAAAEDSEEDSAACEDDEAQLAAQVNEAAGGASATADGGGAEGGGGVEGGRNESRPRRAPQAAREPPPPPQPRPGQGNESPGREYLRAICARSPPESPRTRKEFQEALAEFASDSEAEADPEILALEEQLRGANDKERRRVLNKWYKDTMKAKKAEQILRNQIRSDREPQDASEDDAAHGARPPPRREKTQQDTGRRGGERGRGGVYRQFDKLANSSAGEDDSEDAASPARGGFDGGATRGRGGGGATVGGGGETSKAAAAATAAAAAVNGAGAGGETDGAAAAAAAAAAAVTGAGATADGGRGGGGGGVGDGRKRRGQPSPPCPIQTKPPRFAPNGRQLDDFLPISPRRRGLSVRELVSTLLVTSQHPRVLLLLPSGCLGLESSLLLKDGEMTALYEHFFHLPPGELGPGGCRQPPFTFKESFLDRPSPAGTEAAQRLLADACTRLRGLDPERDRAYADCIFQSLFRELLEGAGRSPLSPDKDGWVDVRKEPVLTAALGSFATHCGGTVGQALKAVAWTSEGVVYDCQGNKAAPCYQQRLMIGAIDADKSHIQHAAAAATASATATNAAAEAEGERRFISIQCHTQGTQATVFLAQRLLVVRHRGGLSQPLLPARLSPSSRPVSAPLPGPSQALLPARLSSPPGPSPPLLPARLSPSSRPVTFHSHPFHETGSIVLPCLLRTPIY